MTKALDIKSIATSSFVIASDAIRAIDTIVSLNDTHKIPSHNQISFNKTTVLRKIICS